MKRREFLKSTALIAAAVGSSDLLHAADKISKGEVSPKGDSPDEGGPLITSAPMLQNYAPDSIGIVFAVSALSGGYVLYSRNPDMSGAKKVKSGGFRVTDLDDKVLRVCLTGLEPDTTYYYRIGADRVGYIPGKNMTVKGSEEDPQIYSFRTAGPLEKAHFCVINDTHARWDPFGRAIEKIAQISPTCVLWNGDTASRNETVEDQIRVFLRPEISRKDYAARTPYLLCSGNHDVRGLANRHLERVWMFRRPEERCSRDWDLGRNFAFRMGDIAMIGLDTAEDKLDTNPRFAGLYNSAAYREAQTIWLRETLQRKEIRKAPFILAFCHIPLFDPDPHANPGDIAPADTDPQYTTDYAAWQRTCARMWGPLLAKAGCQLVITGHQHRFRYDAPAPDRPWAQIVGGGPDLGATLDKGKFPTVIEGLVEGGVLKVTVHNLRTGEVQQTLTFDAKKK